MKLLIPARIFKPAYTFVFVVPINIWKCEGAPSVREQLHGPAFCSQTVKHAAIYNNVIIQIIIK